MEWELLQNLRYKQFSKPYPRQPNPTRNHKPGCAEMKTEGS